MNITPNQIITLTDIKSNPELWTQKFSIIEFTDKNNKPYWTKQYNFIPHWKRYKEARDWIKNTNFPEYNCKIVWNANNEIELVTQNYFGSQRLEKELDQLILGKIRKKLHHQINELQKGDETRKDLAELLKLKTYEELKNFPYAYLYEEELTEWKTKNKHQEVPNQAYDLNRSDLAILWKKQLYFISTFTYINNYKLSVQISAKKCLLSVNYYHWITSQGWGMIEKAPNLIKDTSDILENNQRLHYDFCGDLGIKKIEQQAFLSYQPKFQLFRATYQTINTWLGTREITWSDQADIRGGETKQLAIPSDIKLRRFGKSEAGDLGRSWIKDLTLNTLLKLRSVIDSAGSFRKLAQEILDAKIILTIGPTEMDPYKGSFFSIMEDKEEILFPKNPTFTKWLKEQPHLLDHTTFQFYLFNKITMSANGRYLGIKQKCDNCQKIIHEERAGKPKCQCLPEQRKIGSFVLPYKIFINYSPCNLYYRWEFAYITVKCEVSNEGTFEDWTNPARTMRGFDIKLSGKFLGSGASFGHGASWSDNSEEASKIKQGDDPSPEQEANTERKFKSTHRDYKDKSVEPAMFNANTIDFHYSLGEFFNRLTDPIFFYRCEISELLKNRLDWANNKSHLLNLPLSWKEIGTWTQKVGYWKWSNVSLQKDVNNFFTNIMNRGYYLDDGKEFTNPKLSFSHATSHVAIGTNAWNISIAEEEITEKREIIKENIAKFDGSKLDYGVASYIGSSDDTLYNHMKSSLPGGKHEEKDKPNKLCLGCLTGGGHNNSKDYNYHGEFIVNYGGVIDYAVHADGNQPHTCEIPTSGGKVIVEINSKDGGNIWVEREEITTEIKIKPPKLTVSQEIDQEQLENEVEEEQTEEFKEEKGEDINKEIGEKEQEPEPENEAETEEENEDEQEEEQEEEKGEETEKETETEKEQEQEKEEEEESKSENENEGENEEEDER